MPGGGYALRWAAAARSILGTLGWRRIGSGSPVPLIEDVRKCSLPGVMRASGKVIRQVPGGALVAGELLQAEQCVTLNVRQ